MKADLHIHSLHSDGRLNINEIAIYAKNKGLDVIAITDHDTVGAAGDIEGAAFDVKIILGVEISASFNGEEVHVLGYFKNNQLNNIELSEVLNKKQEQRKLRVHEVIRKLKEFYNIELDYEEIAKFADGTIARPHIAQALIEKYGLTFNEVFERYIGNDCKAYVPTAPFPVEEAIALLKRNNALTVLAHPKLIKKNDINEVLKLGFDGLEVKHPEHTQKDEKRYRKLATGHNLFITGGSDFHEKDSVHADMGSNPLTGEDLIKFLELV